MKDKEKGILQRLVSGVDRLLIFVVVLIITVGIFAIYSATTNSGTSSKYLSIQFLALGIGIIGMLVLTVFNYQYYKQFDKTVYILSILLLISVLIFGSEIRGTKGWFKFGFASFQPVEIAKLMFILTLSSFLDRRWKDAKKPLIFIGAFLILMGHLSLIMMQPDFSSTLSYLPVTLVLLYLIGIEPFYLLCIIIFGALAIGIPLVNTFLKLQPVLEQNASFGGNFLSLIYEGHTGIYLVVAAVSLTFFAWWLMWKLRMRVSILYPVLITCSITFGSLASIPVEKSLKEYQRKRLVVFLNPSADPRGAGYNIIQSKIAIGSGKLLGKGFIKGTQTQLGFLPEQHTDFIFSVIGEEGGWVISQLTILFYLFFIWRALVISVEARDRYGSLVSAGLATMFAFYAIINIGMVMGIMPATGVPLVLMSYGGSSMVSSLLGVGILQSIHMRRHTYY
ncbi:MAG: rod shape-determining protein RodA [Endomicrobium sp.]|nr:rod shape-determining protein RodA [Endomicrobium sp.]